MDEQIKPVAFVIFTGRKKPDVEWMAGEVERGERLYSQQSIDALRARVERLQSSYDQLYVHAESSYQARKEAEAEAESLRAQLRGVQQDALELYEQIPQLPVTIHTLDAATDAFTRFCIDFSEHIDAARKGAE